MISLVLNAARCTSYGRARALFFSSTVARMEHVELLHYELYSLLDYIVHAELMKNDYATSKGPVRRPVVSDQTPIAFARAGLRLDYGAWR